jgi:hypothetical protein
LRPCHTAADAPDTQTAAAKCIREAKADCLLAIKANAGAIFDGIAVYSGDPR